VEAFGEPRIQYHGRQENRGKAACLNFGIRRARGEYVAYLDDDDLWYPHHLSVLTDALDANPDCGVAYSDLYAVVSLKGEAGRRIPLEKRICVCRDYNRLLMFHFNHTLHVSLVHRKDLALRAGGYDESVRVMIDWNLTRKLSFYTDFLHVQQTTGEYYQPICSSDRISDLEREDPERYRQNLRRIRADLPPEPWPKVRKVALVHPIGRWDERARARVRYFADRLDYPCRIVLVNTSPALTEAECRRGLGPLGELKHLSILTAPAESALHEAYLTGARSVEAELYYLPSQAVDLEAGLRLIRGLCQMQASECRAVRWLDDQAGGSPYDVLVRRDVLFSVAPPSGPEAWPGCQTVPPGWLPELLSADLLLCLARECERDGDYGAAQRCLEGISGLEHGGAGDPYLVQLYANVAFARGDHQRAERMCRDLIAAGYGADNWVRLGQILQRRGRHQEALEAYRRGLEGIGIRDEDVASSAFPFACPVDFDAFRAMLGRGESLAALGRAVEAARSLRMASRLRANSARPHVAFGQLLLSHGELDAAEEAFHLAEARERDPRDARVEAGFAAAAEKRGDLREAYRWQLEGLARRPDDDGLLEDAVRLAGRLGRTDEVARLCAEFLGYRPAHVPALEGLAEAWRTLGRQQDAEELSARVAVLREEGATALAQEHGSSPSD
jgi:tetratricopeptide (TPR) repeat protein